MEGTDACSFARLLGLRTFCGLDSVQTGVTSSPATKDLTLKPHQQMGLFKRFVAGLRTVKAVSHASAGWRRDLAMVQFRESDLPEAAQKGLLPEGTLEYARGIIELRIQGKPVAKTRWAWATFLLPYRSFDTEMTQGINIQRALLELERMNEANLDLTLDELKWWMMKRLNVW
jgi:hypothetical protein